MTAEGSGVLRVGLNGDWLRPLLIKLAMSTQLQAVNMIMANKAPKTLKTSAMTPLMTPFHVACNAMAKPSPPNMMPYLLGPLGLNFATPKKKQDVPVQMACPGTENRPRKIAK
jgi:hypothetical protein